MLHDPVWVLQARRVVADAVVQQGKSKVDKEAGHYGHPMHQCPRLALNGNVQHLDAEARGANGGPKLPDVHIAVIVHKKWHEEHDNALVQGIKHVDPKRVLGVRFRFSAWRVQARPLEQQVCRAVLVVDAQNERWQRGEQYIVEHQVKLVNHDRPREPAVQLVPEEDEYERSILIEEVDYSPGQPVVAPVSVD